MKSFTKDKIVDEYFSDLTVTRSKNQELFYLEKNIVFGVYKNVTLCLENTSKHSSKNQFEVYNLIQSNIQKVITSAEFSYQKSYNADLLNEFDIDMVCLNDAEDNSDWQLWLLKKGSFEYCIIDFTDLDPKHISFSA